MNKYVTVGDIQGDVTALSKITQKFMDPVYKFIFLGDILDGAISRPPKMQLEIFFLVVDLLTSGRGVIIEGNHEFFGIHALNNYKLDTFAENGNWKSFIETIENLSGLSEAIKFEIVEMVKQNHDFMQKLMNAVNRYMNSPHRVHALRFGKFHFAHSNWHKGLGRAFAMSNLSLAEGWEGFEATRIQGEEDMRKQVTGVGNMGDVSQEALNLNQGDVLFCGHSFVGNKKPIVWKDKKGKPWRYMMDIGLGKIQRQVLHVAVISHGEKGWSERLCRV